MARKNPKPGPAARIRIDVQPDPRDLPGDFPHWMVIDTRFGDTDAMGHVNNARFLTYCESARIAYWEAATGQPVGLPTHGAEESLILADIRVTFRSPAFFGEMLIVETRIGHVGRSSFTLQHVALGTCLITVVLVHATPDFVKLHLWILRGKLPSVDGMTQTSEPPV